MTKQFNKLLGVGLFLILTVVIMGFDQKRLMDGRSFATVVIGTIILTASQINKQKKLSQYILFARWNAFFSGLLVTLLTLLSIITDSGSRNDTYLAAFIPVIYGSVLYLVFDWISDRQIETAISPTQAMLNIQEATEMLTLHGLSPREIHVALKIMENCTNKAIASQLFISEATVKKHIQNMFRKCGAEDRATFMALYKTWTEDYLQK